MRAAVVQLETLLGEVTVQLPGVLAVVERDDQLIITETFTRLFATTQVEELAMLEHHADETWALHVRASDGEWEMYFDAPGHQPLGAILAELRHDPSGYFWG